MKIKILKRTYLDQARSDDDLRYKLAKLNDCKISTIDRWIQAEDHRLTTATNLEEMRKHFQLLEASELLEEKEVEAA